MTQNLIQTSTGHIQTPNLGRLAVAGLASSHGAPTHSPCEPHESGTQLWNCRKLCGALAHACTHGLEKGRAWLARQQPAQRRD